VPKSRPWMGCGVAWKEVQHSQSRLPGGRRGIYPLPGHGDSPLTLRGGGNMGWTCVWWRRDRRSGETYLISFSDRLRRTGEYSKRENRTGSSEAGPRNQRDWRFEISRPAQIDRPRSEADPMRAPQLCVTGHNVCISPPAKMTLFHNGCCVT